MLIILLLWLGVSFHSHAQQGKEWVIHTPKLPESVVYRLQQSLSSQQGISLVGYVEVGSFLLIRSTHHEWTSDRILRLCSALCARQEPLSLISGCSFFEVADGQAMAETASTMD
jgi:hypothetical protein